MSKFYYFSDCKTLQDVKTRYRDLVFQFHPDRQNGDLETMKKINLEYEQAFAYIKEHPQTEQEKKSNYYADVNDGYREQILKVIHIPGINIEICGCWIWITGDTKPVKDIIKKAGYIWRKNKVAWSWNPPEFKSRRHKSWDMDKIRETYGSIFVPNNPNPSLT